MADRTADPEPAGVATSDTKAEDAQETPAQDAPESPAEDAPATDLEEEDFSWPENTSQTLVIGCILTGVSGVVTICSLLSVGQLFYLSSVEKMFGNSNYYLDFDFAPMTIAFLAVLVWWTGFSVAVLVVNAKLLNLVLKGSYDEIRQSSLAKSVVNALGTNGTVVMAFMVFFSDRYSALAPSFGIVLLLAALFQAGLSVTMFIYGRRLGVMPADLVREKTIRRKVRPMERLSRMITRKRTSFTFNLI